VNRLLIICVSLTLVLMGCRDDYFYSKSYSITDLSWHVEDTKEFTFEVKDTSKVYLWFIDVRHTSDFEFANFYVFPKRFSPSGKIYTDTLNLPLANPSGKWYGKGAGDLVDNRVLWKKDVRFPEIGTYTFSIEQGSREQSLEGISDIGFSMYEYEKN